MNIQSVILGYFFSTVVSTIIMWLLIEKLSWPYLKNHGQASKKPPILTVPMGIVERVLYTTAFLVNKPIFIAFWITLKVATKWRLWTEENRGPYNIFLMGTALNILFSYSGAIIASQKILIF